jgi:hypothetical protein
MPQERRLVEEPDQSRQQMLDRGARSAEFTETRKGLDSMPGVPPPLPVVAQAAAGQSDGDGTALSAGGDAAPVDYDG